MSLYYGMWSCICLTAKLSKCIHIEKYPQRIWYVSRVSTIHYLVNKNLEDVNNNCSISLTSFLSSLCWLSACPYFLLWCVRVLSGVPPGSSVHGIFRIRIWRRLPFSPPGHLFDPGMGPRDLMHISPSSALAGGFFTTMPHFFFLIIHQCVFESFLPCNMTGNSQFLAVNFRWVPALNTTSKSTS